MSVFRIVDQNLARNPIARAVSRVQAKAEIRNFTAALYLADESTDMREDVHSAAKALTVAIRVLELTGEADTPRCAVIRGALSALTQCAERGFRWKPQDAPAVDVALQHATEILTRGDATTLQRAWAFVQRLEEAA